MDYHCPIIEDNHYHILSRAVGNEKIFIEPDNYRFFLDRFSKYINPVAETYAYALLPNHFHFQVHIKRYESILAHARKLNSKFPERDAWLSPFVLQQFSNMLNSYTKAFNKKYHRKGSLFIDYMRRVEIKSDGQFTSTIFYIHKNAVHHGLCKHIEDWKYCSYNAFLSTSKTMLMRRELLDWFGSTKKYIDFHQQPIHLKNAVVLE